MNRKWLAIAIMFISAIAVNAQDKSATTQKAPESALTEAQKSGYGAGVLAGRNYLRIKEELGLDLDIDMVAKGLKDAYTKVPLSVSDEELKAIEDQWKKNVQEKQEGKIQELAAKNKKDGDDFLLANKVKEGVMAFPSSDINMRGVQYRVIAKGDGPMPAETDTVEVSFILKTIDGRELGNTYKANRTVLMQISQNILGLKTALLKMPVGSKWEIVIPSEQAYGDKGSKTIEPNMTIIFELELVKIESKSEPKTETPTPNTTPK
jgi:FKBP-type peptidyl-prolyl cis-trans isomerase